MVNTMENVKSAVELFCRLMLEVGISRYTISTLHMGIPLEFKYASKTNKWSPSCSSILGFFAYGMIDILLTQYKKGSLCIDTLPEESRT